MTALAEAGAVRQLCRWVGQIHAWMSHFVTRERAWRRDVIADWGCSYGEGRCCECVRGRRERETFVMLSRAGGGFGGDQWHAVLRSNGRSEQPGRRGGDTSSKRRCSRICRPPATGARWWPRSGLCGSVQPAIAVHVKFGRKSSTDRTPPRPRSAAFHTRLIWAPGQERAQGEIQRPMVRSRVKDDEMEGAVTRENPPNIALCGTTALLVRLNASACPTSPYCAV